MASSRVRPISGSVSDRLIRTESYRNIFMYDLKRFRIVFAIKAFALSKKTVAEPLSPLAPQVGWSRPEFLIRVLEPDPRSVGIVQMGGILTKAGLHTISVMSFSVFTHGFY